MTNVQQNTKFGTPQASDKAILAITLLRLQRPADAKGIGPNRDDLPIFKEVCDAWANGLSPPKETVFMARHRVQKYHRQIKSSVYAKVIESDASKTLYEMVSAYQQETKEMYCDLQLEQEIKVGCGYGDW